MAQRSIILALGPLEREDAGGREASKKAAEV